MAFNEFENVTLAQLKTMLFEVEKEADELERECRERFEEAVATGMAYGNSDPACDYVADDLFRRADVIRQEIKQRGEPSAALLEEYRLSLYKYHVLQICDTPHFWKTWRLTHSITCLYGLMDRGLLSGPPRGKPHSQPFQTTDQGRAILTKIDQGLHIPGWLSAGKLTALNHLACGYATDQDLLHISHRMSILSLKDAGYIQRNDDTWHITTLGRSALREYEETNQN